MSIIVKAGAGLVAGVVAGVLGLAFLPQVEPTAVKPRQAVGMPQIVAVSAPTPKIQAAPVAIAAASLPANSLPANSLPAKPEPAPSLRAGLSPDATPDPAVAKLAAVMPAKPAAPAPAVAETRAVASGADLPPAVTGDQSARWSVRGLTALAKGDLSTARLFLIRAAEAGDPRAWIALADTYDPAMLAKLGVVGAPGDPQRARQYLVKAAAAGLGIAKDRMAALDQDPGTAH